MPVKNWMRLRITGKKTFLFIGYSALIMFHTKKFSDTSLAMAQNEYFDLNNWLFSIVLILSAFCDMYNVRRKYTQLSKNMC